MSGFELTEPDLPTPLPKPKRDPEEAASARRAMLAARLARDPALQRAAQVFLKAVLAAAESPAVGKLAAGTLIDFAVAKVED